MMTDRELMQQALEALEKLRVGLLTMQKHAESYGESWARAYVKEYRDMLPGAAEQQFRALNAMQHRLSDVAEGVIEGFDAIVALRERLAQPQRTHWEGCEEVHPECRKQRREWVWLTDEEIEEVWADESLGLYAISYYIEAKVREKNNV